MNEKKGTSVWTAFRQWAGGMVRRALLHPRRLALVVLVLVAYVLYLAYAERTARQVLLLRKKVEERRAEYLILRSEFLKATSEQEIQNQARKMNLGLVKPDEPPVRIKKAKGRE